MFVMAEEGGAKIQLLCDNRGRRGKYVIIAWL